MVDDVRMTFLEDRRRTRSADPLVALHYQLAQARQEGQLDAIVVADDSGVVVAGAGAWAVCEELAAYAPLLAQGVWHEPGLAATSRVAELCTEVDVQSVEVEGPAVENWADRIAGQHGYVAISHTLEIFGTCPKCAQSSM